MLAMDDKVANAIETIAMAHSDEWAYIEDYVARCLVKARDRCENGPEREQQKMSGLCLGLRHLFGLRRRAIAHLNGETMQHDNEIVGEAEHLLDEAHPTG